MIVGATGLIGLGFHTYNILKRPGELDALNLFYGAPIGAPAALTLAGLYGVIAGEMLSGRDYVRTRLPRHTAGLIAFSLMGTIAEAGLLHFRGKFQNPVMYAPVTIPPLAAVGDRRGRAVAARGRRCRAAAQGDGAARDRRPDVPRLRNSPQHGRLAQLEPDDPARTAAARAARLSRHRRRRSRHPPAAREGAAMSEFRTPYPTYDVLDKWDSPSWNDQTREAVRARLEEVPERRFLSAQQWSLLEAIADRLVPQPDREEPVPIVPWIDDMLHQGPRSRLSLCRHAADARRLAAGSRRDRRRSAQSPRQMLRGARADGPGRRFCAMSRTTVSRAATGASLPAGGFFKHHLLKQVVAIYYSHPAAWSESVSAVRRSPRGYARLGFDERDPWEAEELDVGACRCLM